MNKFMYMSEGHTNHATDSFYMVSQIKKVYQFITKWTQTNATTEPTEDRTIKYLGMVT